MNSIYLRDPDGNLIEIAVYEEEEKGAVKKKTKEWELRRAGSEQPFNNGKKKYSLSEERLYLC